MPLKDGARNDILPWAPNGDEANGDLMPLEDYEEDLQRKRGFSSGLARRSIFNRSKRQALHMSAGLAQFLANRYAAGIVDDGDLDKVEAALFAVISGLAEDYADEVGDALAVHAAQTAVHGATSAAIASRLILRDVNGRAKIAAPVDPADIANLQAVGDQIAAEVPTYAGFGLDYDPITGLISVNFSNMPTDKFEEMLKSIRVPIWLSVNIAIYVRLDGSNTNDGFANTPSRAFRTIQHATDYVANNYNFGNYSVNIYVGEGHFDEQVRLPRYNSLLGIIYIRCAGKDLTRISMVRSERNSGTWHLYDCTIATDGVTPFFNTFATGDLAVAEGSVIFLRRVRLLIDLPFAGTIIRAAFAQISGILYFYEGCEINTTGDPQVIAAGVEVLNGGRLYQYYDLSVDITSTYAGIFIQTSTFGQYLRVNPSATDSPPVIIGSAAGMRRYSVGDLSIINTGGGGPDFFPGTSAGVVATLGLYA